MESDEIELTRMDSYDDGLYDGFVEAVETLITAISEDTNDERRIKNYKEIADFLETCVEIC